MVEQPGKKEALAYADLDIADFVNDVNGDQNVKSVSIPLKNCSSDPSASIQVQVVVKFMNETLDDETKRIW